MDNSLAIKNIETIPTGQFQITDDGIYVNEGAYTKLVISKEVFTAAYNRWIRKKLDKPLYYFVDVKRVLANTEPAPNFEDYYSRDTGYSEESSNKYLEAWDKYVTNSIIIDDFYTEAVAQRVCDELNARRILEE